MLLIDEIVDRDQQRIECRKQFREDEFFFEGHYPGNPIVPGVILCEACMQAGALLLATLDRLAVGTPVATRLEKVKFRRMVKPGETLTIQAVLVDQVSSAFFLKAKGLVDGKDAVRLEFACTLAP